MHDFNDFLDLIKKVSVDSIDASVPVNIVYGTVICINPLKVNIEQKLCLSQEQLIVARNVTTYKSSITVDGVKKEIIFHNELIVGDKIILIRIHGGQKFLIMDRMII